jgi:hypothetical protein
VTPGYKFNDWELRRPGPARVGPRDVAAGTIVVPRGCRRRSAPAPRVSRGRSSSGRRRGEARRIRRAPGRATTFQRASTHVVSGWDELVDVNGRAGRLPRRRLVRFAGVRTRRSGDDRCDAARPPIRGRSRGS